MASSSEGKWVFESDDDAETFSHLPRVRWPIAKEVVERFRQARFTDRLQEQLAWITQGLTSDETATRMSIQPDTEKSHRKRIVHQAGGIPLQLAVTLALRGRLVGLPDNWRAFKEPAPQFTSEELEAAYGVARGLTNIEIADSLFISPAAVKSRLSKAFEKTGATNRIEFAVLCQTWNLLPDLFVHMEGREFSPIDPRQASERRLLENMRVPVTLKDKFSRAAGDFIARYRPDRADLRGETIPVRVVGEDAADVEGVAEERTAARAEDLVDENLAPETAVVPTFSLPRFVPPPQAFVEVATSEKITPAAIAARIRPRPEREAAEEVVAREVDPPPAGHAAGSRHRVYLQPRSDQLIDNDTIRKFREIPLTSRDLERLALIVQSVPREQCAAKLGVDVKGEIEERSKLWDKLEGMPISLATTLATRDGLLKLPPDDPVLERPPPTPTERQLEALYAMARGHFTDESLGKEMGISPNNAHKKVRGMVFKTEGVKGRAHLVATYQTWGLLPDLFDDESLPPLTSDELALRDVVFFDEADSRTRSDPDAFADTLEIVFGFVETNSGAGAWHSR